MPALCMDVVWNVGAGLVFAVAMPSLWVASLMGRVSDVWFSSFSGRGGELERNI